MRNNKKESRQGKKTVDSRRVDSRQDKTKSKPFLSTFYLLPSTFYSPTVYRIFPFPFPCFYATYSPILHPSIGLG